mmetsp:Transcript_89278/g.177495  ORF Transcript_89278/g.177495 Transcript_89278/m.177495 type:complete len:206 (-) Transcript_89278:540-1157(-)
MVPFETLHTSLGNKSLASAPGCVEAILRKPVEISGASSRPPSSGKPSGRSTWSTQPRTNMPSPTWKCKFLARQGCPSLPGVASFRPGTGGTGANGFWLPISRRCGTVTTSKGGDHVSCTTPSFVHWTRTTAWSPPAKPVPMVKLCAKLHDASSAGIPATALRWHFMVMVSGSSPTGTNTFPWILRYDTYLYMFTPCGVNSLNGDS